MPDGTQGRCGAGQGACRRIRAAGAVDKGAQDLIPATPRPAHAGAEAVEKIRVPDPEWRLFEYIQLRRVSDRGGLQSRRVRLLRALSVAHQPLSQRHVDSAAIPVAALTAGPVRQGNRADDAGRRGRPRDRLQPHRPVRVGGAGSRHGEHRAVLFRSVLPVLLAPRAGEGQGLLSKRRPRRARTARSLLGSVPARRLRSRHWITSRKTSPAAHTRPSTAPTSARSSRGRCSRRSNRIRAIKHC